MVLYLHGTGNDGEFLMGRMVQEFISQNMVVVSVDLEGHGRDSTGLWTEDVCRFMDDVMGFVKSLGYGSVHLVGHSLGGAVALIHNHEHPSLYESISCLTVPVRVHLSCFYKELMVLGQKSIWMYLKMFGFKGCVPALGPVRRSVFPIRMSPHHTRPYPLEMARWLHDQNLGELLAERASQSDPRLLWVEARWDGVASPLDEPLKKLCIQGDCYLQVPTTHLGVLISAEVIRGIREHIQQT